MSDKPKTNYWKIITNGILKENPTLVLILGTCPTLAVTTQAVNGIGMGIAAMVVLIGSNVVISLLKKVIPDSVRIPCYIVVIAAFVTIVQFLVKAYAPSLDTALGVYLPLITTNCAVLGVALTNVQKEYGIFTGMVNGFATALGFTISIVILAGIREKLEYNDYPESFKGMPMVLVTAGLMAIAFCGFSGLL